MDYKDVLAFVKGNPVFSIATMDGDQPRVRGFLSVFFEGDDRIYFTTAATKKVYKQLSINTKVELCYISPNRMLRITSRVEFVDDLAKKEELIKKQFYLKGFSADSPDFILMRLSHGKAHFWTLADNLKGDGIEVIEF